MTTTRRQFLSTAFGSTAVVTLGGVVPRFLLEAAEQAASSDQRVLVVLQLSGGNDGLNTVIPHADPIYRKLRPKLAIPSADVLKINDELGLHPSLRGLADLLEAGKLAIVQGVGYPDPNRSHFESMDIWHTCQRKADRQASGWLGRYLDGLPNTAGGDVPAMHLGAEKQPLALSARNVRVPSVSSLERFRLQAGDDGKLQATVQQLAAAERKADNDLLGFVQTSTTSALEASRRVEQAGKRYQTEVAYPESALAQKLRTVAQLIDAGLGTRIYYVELDGFDTHSRQAAAHAGLLNQLAGAVAAFVKDIAQHGHGGRVLLMSFSEFGRRLEENASEGTDHGAAAPVFLAGDTVRAGLVGSHPSLEDLTDGDLKFHTDFRQVYAAVLDQWLGVASGPILGGEFKPAPVFG